jgi:putative Holliday junction resolvase
MSPGDYIGLDVGERRTGIARASAVAKLAEPLKIVETTKAAEEIKELIKENGVKAVIVGLPRNLQGDDTPQTRWVRDWVENLKKEIALPFYFQDEALTTELAQSRLGGDGYKDDEAASIILQDFLDSELTNQPISQ